MGGDIVPLVLWVFNDSVSEVVLGVGSVTMAVVTVRVLLDLLFVHSTAFRLERDDRFIVGSRI